MVAVCRRTSFVVITPQIAIAGSLRESCCTQFLRFTCQDLTWRYTGSLTRVTILAHRSNAAEFQDVFGTRFRPRSTTLRSGTAGGRSKAVTSTGCARPQGGQATQSSLDQVVVEV